MASSAASATEDTKSKAYYVVVPTLPEAPSHRDPYTAPWLRKYVVVLQVLMHLQMGSTPILITPMSKAFHLDAATMGVYGGTVYIAMSVGVGSTSSHQKKESVRLTPFPRPLLTAAPSRPASSPITCSVAIASIRLSPAPSWGQQRASLPLPCSRQGRVSAPRRYCFCDCSTGFACLW